MGQKYCVGGRVVERVRDITDRIQRAPVKIPEDHEKYARQGSRKRSW